ncbi:unnamed protein product, partial [marine sediment metagenome]
YLHVFDWPDNRQLIVPRLENKVKKAYLLADKTQKQLAVIRDNIGNVVIKVPEKPLDLADTVIVLEVKGNLEVK